MRSLLAIAIEIAALHKAKEIYTNIIVKLTNDSCLNLL
jgi:hypothetical protein